LGFDGDDQISGGAGNDELAGGEGNDLLHGGAGADQLVGGGGIDTVSYEDSSVGISVYLGPGQHGFYGDAQGDTYAGIENVTGSSHDDGLYGDAGSNELSGLAGKDWLEGDEGDDRLFGGEGDDSLSGGDGVDILDGGDGIDYVRYDDDSAVTGVIVNLATGMGSGGYAAGDTYFGIENAEGSDFDDILIGNAGNNYLYGEDGDDVLIGGAGEDILEGGPGHDILTGDGDGSVAADIFVTKHVNHLITDFQQGVDKIRMRDEFTFQDFGSDGELAWGTVQDAHSLDASDKFFFDTDSHTLYRCQFINGTLTLGDAVVTVGPEIARLQASDFLVL
jgi:Ca2+-binding RTX toxin-like protein